MLNLPQKFLERMQKQLGGGYSDYLSAMNMPPQKGLHINTLKCDLAEVDSSVDGLTPVLDTANNGRLVVGDYATRPTLHPYYAAGLYYMQEPSAMLPVMCAELGGGNVLDMCAAPGGKSSQLAIKTKGRGLLVSNEIERSRAAILKENIVRMGYRNVAVTNFRPDRLAEELPAFFDTVLVDAPCSGEGMMRKEEQAVLCWSEANVRACAVRQKEILSSANACLKSGGTLIYSTCTFSDEEDEEVVRELVSMGYEIMPIPQAIAQKGITHGYGYKFYPHIAGGEGQFVCVLKKTAPATGYKPRKQTYKPATKAELAEIAKILNIDGLTISKNDNTFFTSAGLPCGTPCMMDGVLLGFAEKDGRFTPAHNLFTAYGDRVYNRVSFSADDSRITSYLKGEEIDGDVPNGWGVLCVDSHAIGGYKATNGRLKNHYPKNLRI